MDESLSVQSGGIIRQYLFPRRHTAVLVALVTLMAVRPLLGNSAGTGGTLMFSLALLALMLVSLYTIQVDELVGERQTLVAQKKKRSMIGWALEVATGAALLIVPSLAGRLLFGEELTGVAM